MAQAQEETANPYNANKEWHKQEETDFESANNVFFSET